MENPLPDTRVIQPGGTIGVFGGGQLGRMLAEAARPLGYRTHVFSDQPDCPAGQVADELTTGDLNDEAALRRFIESVDVVTLEFENVPTAALELSAQSVPARPAAPVLHITQDRLREKRFLTGAGVECPPFAEVTDDSSLAAAVEQIGTPAVLKTAADGYDGKGQAVVHSPAEAAEAWNRLGRKRSIFEGFVDYQCEFSVIVARSPSGEVSTYGPIRNDHANHILDVSVLPDPSVDAIGTEARAKATHVAERLGSVGVLCVEFFFHNDGRLLANEIAPRTHNSGHLTIEGCETSQFEQQVRAVCGLPLGPTTMRAPAAAMANLLGDAWQGGEPDWDAVRSNPNAQLHLYGKANARPGRKMAHITATGESPAEARARVLAARDAACRRVAAGMGSSHQNES